MVAVRGITSRVDIVWYDIDGQFRNASDVTATIIMGTTALYRDSFNISSLTRQHDGRFYGCVVVIHSEPPLFIYTYITLNVTCKFTIKYTYFYHTYIYMLMYCSYIKRNCTALCGHNSNYACRVSYLTHVELLAINICRNTYICS